MALDSHGWALRRVPAQAMPVPRRQERWRGRRSGGGAGAFGGGGGFEVWMLGGVSMVPKTMRWGTCVRMEDKLQPVRVGEGSDCDELVGGEGGREGERERETLLRFLCTITIDMS